MGTVGPLSHSSVQTYLECPLRWKFLYVDRLPETPRGYFSFGRTVHAVLEELLRPFVVPGARLTDNGDRQRTLDDFGRGVAAAPRLLTSEETLAVYDRLWVGEGYQSAEEEARYRALGADLLSRYREVLAREPPTPVAVEAHLEATWDGIPVHGYLDRIDRTPSGGLAILDYKTSRELSREDALASDQLAFYQVLVEKNFPEPVERLTLYHLRSLTPLESPPRDRSRLDGLLDRVGQVSDGIRSDAFEPTPGRQCARCEFRPRCPEFRTVGRADRERIATLVDRFARLRADEERVERELTETAGQLHAEAEKLGVHRFAGADTQLVRRREETWRYPPEKVAGILAEHGREGRIDPSNVGEVRRLLRDTREDPALRRRVEGVGGRTVKWFWVLEETNGASGNRRSE